MVFSEFRDSLKSVTKKMADTVSGTVVAPLNTVKESMTKTVIGPRLDLLEQLGDSYKKNIVMEYYSTEIKNLGGRLRKQKFSAVKAKVILKLLTQLAAIAVTIKTYEETKTWLSDTLNVYKKEIEEGRYVKTLKDTTLKIEKSNTLIKREKQILVVEFQEMQMAVQGFIRKVDEDISKTMTVGKKAKYGYDTAFDTAKTTLKKNYSLALDQEFMLISAWRELSSHIRVLQNHVSLIARARTEEGRAFGPDRTNITVQIKKEEKYIQSMIKTRINEQLKAIEKLEKQIADTNTQLGNDFSTYMKARTTQLQTSKKAIADTDAALIHLLRTQSSGVKKNRSEATVLVKQHTKLHTVLLATIKEPYTNPGAFRKAVDAVTVQHNLIQDNEITFETFGYARSIGLEALISMYADAESFMQKSLYHKLELYRDQSLQYQLMNRVKQRHTTQIKSIREKLVDLKQTHSGLFTPLLRTIEKKSEQYNKLIADNTVRVTAAKKEIDVVKGALRDTATYELYTKTALLYVKSQLETQVYATYASFLTKTLKEETNAKTLLEAQRKKIEHFLRKEKVIMEDKEQSSKTIKKTAALSVEVKKMRSELHTKEVFFEAISHQLDLMNDHIKELQDLQSAYLNQSKKAAKEVQSQESRMKYLAQKLKSSNLCKDISLPQPQRHKAITLF